MREALEKERKAIDIKDDSIVIPRLIKGRSVDSIKDMIKDIDAPTNICQVLNGFIIINDNRLPIDMHVRIRVLETSKPTYICSVAKIYDNDLDFIETTPSAHNITARSVIMRGFKSMRDSRWAYFQYGDGRMRCTLKPSFIKAKSLRFDALTSPFVSINFNDIVSYDGMFSNMPNVREIVIEKFDTLRVKSMNGMFVNCPKLQAIAFIDCNLSSVESMEHMCSNCTALREIKFIRCRLKMACSYWKMFNNCPSLSSITAPSVIYQIMMRETPGLISSSITWRAAV
jgi:hypothetical protein